ASRAGAIDVNVVHHCKKPGAKVGAATIQVQLCPGSLERVLDKIVSAGAVPDERPSVAPQSRDQLDQALGFVHGEQASGGRYSTLFGRVGQCRNAAQISDERIEVRRAEL